MVVRLDVLSVMVITKSLRIAQNAYHISSIFIILTDILKAKPGDRFQTSLSSLTRWIHVVSALRWSSIPGQRQNSQNSCWKKSGEGWRSFKGHCVRSCPKDGEHRSQVRRRRRLLLLQVLPMSTSSRCPHPNFNVMIKRTLHDAFAFYNERKQNTSCSCVLCF